MLPDDTLLEMFTFYLDEARGIDGWHTLVHVCRRWRTVIFTSPRRLNLQLLCTSRRPVRELLDIWPALPIIISDRSGAMEGAHNIIAALERNDRVRELDLWNASSSLLEGFASLPPDPFPVLTSLQLHSNDESSPVLPESFLGASAPRLRSLFFGGIPFLGVQKLLSSAHDLVTLHLRDIPHSGYISPEVTVTCLSSMTSLTTLYLAFRSPRSYPNQARRRPLSLATLPALTSFQFKGVSEYFEDLVSRIDAPELNMVEILFFNQVIFNIPQLPQFIDRLGKLKALNQADIVFSENTVGVILPGSTYKYNRAGLTLGISCRQTDWQLSSLAQTCSSTFPLLSTLQRLNIHENQYSLPHWQDEMENTQWLDLLQPFAAVKKLHLSNAIAQLVAPTLNKLPTETVTGLMPLLQSVFVMGRGPSQPVASDELEEIEQFVVARELFSHPKVVAVHYQRRRRSWTTIGRQDIVPPPAPYIN